MRHIGAILVFAACAATGTWSEGLLFSASFDESLTAEVAGGLAEPVWARQGTKVVEGGVSGNCAEVQPGGNLTCDAPGNVYWERGTLAFWWSCQEPVGNTEFDVATIGSFDHFYYGRWYRLYCTGGRFVAYLVDWNFDFKRAPVYTDFHPEQGEWYHIAMAWDAARGIALSVNGDPIGRSEKPWYMWTHLNQIGLGMSAVASHAKSGALRRQRFDQVRVYDRWLPDDQVARLAQGQEPEIVPLDEEQVAAHRIASLGLDQVEGMPVAEAAPPAGLDAGTLVVRQPQVVTARDVRRTQMTGVDGKLSSKWPSGRRYSEEGQRYETELVGPATRPAPRVMTWGGEVELMAVGELINYVSLTGTLAGEVQFTTGEQTVTVLKREKADPMVVRATLPACMRPDTAQVTRVIPEDPAEVRKAGSLVELSLLDVSCLPIGMDAIASPPPHLKLARLDDLGEDGRLVHDEYLPLDRTTVVPGGDAGGELELPKMRVMHLLSAPADERMGVSEVFVRLALEAQPGTVAHIELIHPLNYTRRQMMLDCVVQDGQRPFDLLLDTRDLVLEPGRRIHLTVQFARPVKIDLARSKLNVHQTSLENALRQYFPDQMRMLKAYFMGLSEARPWGWPPEKIKRLAELFNCMRQLRDLRPEDPTVRAYYHWTHASEPKPRLDIEPADPRMPAWASYQVRLLEMLRQVPYWWIENRQAPNGEFGSNDGLNDDSVLVQDWIGLCMMDGPDEKLRASAAKVADQCWQRTITDGINNQVTDPLHAYEWGVNVNSMMAVLDYGNPVYLERLMQAARHYERLTAINPRGHRHYVSNRYGRSAIVTEGRYGWDTTSNALNMQPAALLAWYNGSPLPKQCMTEWVDAWLEDLVDEADGKGRAFTVEFATGKKAPQRNIRYGFPSILWACYEVTGEQKYLDGFGLLYEADLRHNPKQPSSSFLMADRLLGRLAREDFRRDLLAMAEEADVWGAPIRYASSQPRLKYLHWRMTGDREPAIDALRATLSDMTWELPMFTTAEQSPDRLWLPQRLASMMRLGDIAMLRNEIFPLHYVSWEDADGSLAAWVLDKGEDRLRAWVYNVGDEPLECLMRVWKLRHGLYEVGLGPDADEDGEIDGEVARRPMELARYRAVPLSLPPKTLMVVDIRQMQELEPIARRADLAVCADDFEHEPEADVALIRVHNIGAETAPAFAVTVNTDAGGETVHQLPALEAPTDLEPKVRTIELEGLGKAGANTLTVHVDPVDAVPEITEANNRVRIALPQEAAKGTEQ